MDKIQKTVLSGLVVLAGLYSWDYFRFRQEEKSTMRNLAPHAYYAGNCNCKVLNEDINNDGKLESVLRISSPDFSEKYILTVIDGKCSVEKSR